MKRITGFLFGLLGLAAAAQAQTIYRCGNEYTRVPCSAGKPVDIDDRAVNSRRAAEARAVVDRQNRLAAEMASDRRRNEAEQRLAGPASLSPSKGAEPASAASASLKPKKRAKAKIRVGGEGDFIATSPKPSKGTAR
ncbi:MAG: hypothetical protein ABIO71_06970 [Caldimonas sp.]